MIDRYLPLGEVRGSSASSTVAKGDGNLRVDAARNPDGGEGSAGTPEVGLPRLCQVCRFIGDGLGGKVARGKKSNYLRGYVPSFSFVDHPLLEGYT